MTSRERIEAALRHQEPDRTPVFEYVLLTPVADQLLGRPYGGDRANWPDLLRELGWNAAVRRVAADRVDLALKLGHDMMYVFSTGSRHALEPKVETPAPPLPDDPVDRLRLRNQADAEQPAAPTDDYLLIFAYVMEEMERRGVDLPVLAGAYAHGVWTDVDLMQTMLLDPEVAHEHFALCTRKALGLVAAYAQLGIDQFGVGGDFAGTRPLISPKYYHEFIMPEVRKVSRRVHEMGGWAVNASDGDLWPVIEDYLVGCEVDGYLEIDLHAGMDLGRLKSAYGDRITFYGNLDPGNTLSFASPDEVRQHTLECLEKGMGKGGHILCASNAIIASVSLENYLAVVNAYRDRFGLPRFSL